MTNLDHAYTSVYSDAWFGIRRYTSCITVCCHVQKAVENQSI